MAAMVDEHGQRVIAFMGKVKNLTRIAELVESICDIALSGDWKTYKTAIGTDRWLDAEFDYFLIACDVPFDDVARVIAYNRQAAELGPLMDRNAPPEQRRSLEDASKKWHSVGPESLVDRAGRLGWISPTNKLASPIPKTTRRAVETGIARPKSLQVTWTSTEQLAERLLKRITADPNLEDLIFKELNSRRSTKRYHEKRRSAARNGR